MKRTTKSLVTTGLLVAIAFTASAGSLPLAEIPAQMGSQISKAQPEQRQALAETLVTQSVKANPSLASAIVAAVAQASPEVAATAAVAAATQEPKQIGEITKAAVSAAKTQTGKIVAAVCQKFPTKYNLVAVVAYEAAPAAGKEILDAVAASVPAVKPFIARSSFTTVPTVIADTESMLKAAVASSNMTADQFLSKPVSVASAAGSATALPPTSGGGVVAASGTPTYAPVGSVVNPGGDRGYSTP